MKKQSGIIIYSPTDLIRYLASPFASWLDRYHLENLGAITPDEQTDEEKLLSRTGDEHEQSVLKGYKATDTGLIEIPKDDKKFGAAHAETLEAITRRRLFIRRRCATVSSRVMPISWSSTFQENISLGYEAGTLAKALLPYSTLLLLRNAGCYDGAGDAGADRGHSGER